MAAPRIPLSLYATPLHSPEESHLFIFLFIVADDLRRGHADLHAVDDKLPGAFQSLAGESVLEGNRAEVRSSIGARVWTNKESLPRRAQVLDWTQPGQFLPSR